MMGTGDLGLAGKVALVTGSASGIGEAIARRLAAEGARVVIHGRPVQATDAEQIASEISERGGEAVVEMADLAEAAECTRLVETVVARFGRIDILVNNAAIIPRARIEDTDAALFDQTIAVDLRAPLLTIRAALPHFRAQGGGRVLNIGSINTYCGEAALLAYSIAKGGLSTLTRNLADAHGAEGIRVNQINPGWVLTENEAQRKRDHGLRDDWYKDVPKVYAPSGRILLPEEMAAAAIYWLSDEAGPISGQVVDLEQHPFIGRNPPKDTGNIPP